MFAQYDKEVKIFLILLLLIKVEQNICFSEIFNDFIISKPDIVCTKDVSKVFQTAMF